MKLRESRRECMKVPDQTKEGPKVLLLFGKIGWFIVMFGRFNLSHNRFNYAVLINLVLSNFVLGLFRTGKFLNSSKMLLRM